MYTSVLFDLDGTLTDPHVGIVESVRFALAKCGQPVPPARTLNWVIGPPLRESFEKLVATADEALLQQLLDSYRERFAPIGLFENEVYPGIKELLTTLQQHHIDCYVATSKAHVFAKQILTHFDLLPHFKGVYGAELDGRRSKKAEVVAQALAENDLAASTCIMIGDREHDIYGAKANNLASIGVLYGFGTADELTAAGATYIVATPAELARLLLQTSD